MMKASSSEWHQRNALLRRLQPESFERLVPMLEPVTLGDRQVLYQPGQKVTDIYFPDTAILCLLTIMEDGRTIEAVTVGQEGASWISASCRGAAYAMSNHGGGRGQSVQGGCT